VEAWPARPLEHPDERYIKSVGVRMGREQGRAGIDRTYGMQRSHGWCAVQKLRRTGVHLAPGQYERLKASTG